MSKLLCDVLKISGGGNVPNAPPLLARLVWLHCDESSRLDANEDWKVVRWCRTQASRHNSQGVVDGGVDEAGISTAAPDRRTVL